MTLTQPVVQNPLYGNESFLQDNKHARNIHFHIKGCEPKLVLK